MYLKKKTELLFYFNIEMLKCERLWSVEGQMAKLELRLTPHEELNSTLANCLYKQLTLEINNLDIFPVMC